VDTVNIKKNVSIHMDIKTNTKQILIQQRKYKIAAIHSIDILNQSLISSLQFFFIFIYCFNQF